MAKDATDNDRRREGLDGGGSGEPTRAMVALRPRNSSGSGSGAAKLLQLQAQLDTAYLLIEALAEGYGQLSGDADLLSHVKAEITRRRT